MKYIEVSGQLNSGNVIIEITMGDEFFEEIGGESEIGHYVCMEMGWSSVNDWDVFDEPFLMRVSRLLSEAKFSEQQTADFMHMTQELKQYLLDFTYKRRMKFLATMFELLRTSSDQGAIKVLKQVNDMFDKGLDRMIDKE